MTYTPPPVATLRAQSVAEIVRLLANGLPVACIQRAADRDPSGVHAEALGIYAPVTGTTHPKSAVSGECADKVRNEVRTADPKCPSGAVE